MKERGSRTNQLVSKVLKKGYVLTPPDDKSPRYVELWNAIAQGFPDGHFVKTDCHVLDSFVRLSMQYDDVMEIVDREGYIIEDRFGIAKEHPLLKTSLSMLAQLKSLRSALRMQPSSRFDDQNMIRATNVTEDPVGTPGWKPKLATG